MPRLSPLSRYQPWLIWGLAASFFFSMYVIRVSPSIIQSQLITAFKTNVASLSLLSAFFYYAYLLMQIPSGILIDRYGSRLLLGLALLLCAFSVYQFSHTNSLEAAKWARFLTGAVSAFSFIGAIQLANAWFPPKKLGLIVGITQGLGMLGASVGNGPVAYLNTLFGWQNVYLGMAALFSSLAVLIFLFVKDHPLTQSASTAKAQVPKTKKNHPKNYFKNVLCDKPTWINAFYAGLVFAPVQLFGEFWGVSYIEHVHHFAHQPAANALSLLFIGWFIGGPLAGYFSHHLGRKPVMILSAAFGVILFPIILYWPSSSLLQINCISFLIGLSNGGLIAAYTAAGELHPKHSTGLCMGITNMISILIGAALQPIVGLLLDSPKVAIHLVGTHLHTAEHYQYAMLLLPVCALLALILSFFVKETLPKT